MQCTPSHLNRSRHIKGFEGCLDPEEHNRHVKGSQFFQLGADYSFIFVMNEEGNEMTVGVMNVDDTTAVYVQRPKKERSCLIGRRRCIGR